MPRVPLKKLKIKLIIQSACHTVYYVSKYAQSYGGGVFSGRKKVLQGCKSNRKFYKGENRK